MNRNQVKGTVKDIAGKVQEEAGKLVGNKEQQAKGLLKQVEGKAEKRFGDVKEIVKARGTAPPRHACTWSRSTNTCSTSNLSAQRKTSSRWLPQRAA
jgi:uncharacterized protein YjbJ (UPF0337 family)